MTATVEPRRFGFGLFTLAMVAAFIGLGIWQLERRVAKHALIAALTERLAAEPVSLPPASAWDSLTAEKDEFRRVRFKAVFAGPDAMVYSAGSAVREDISGPGTWAFVPARLPGGEIVAINAGFVQNTMQDRAEQDRVVARLVTGSPIELTGYVRFPERAGWLTPAANAATRADDAAASPALAAVMLSASIKSTSGLNGKAA